MTSCPACLRGARWSLLLRPVVLALVAPSLFNFAAVVSADYTSDGSSDSESGDSESSTPFPGDLQIPVPLAEICANAATDKGVCETLTTVGCCTWEEGYTVDGDYFGTCLPGVAGVQCVMEPDTDTDTNSDSGSDSNAVEIYCETGGYSETTCPMGCCEWNNNKCLAMADDISQCGGSDTDTETIKTSDSSPSSDSSTATTSDSESNPESSNATAAVSVPSSSDDDNDNKTNFTVPIMAATACLVLMAGCFAIMGIYQCFTPPQTQFDGSHERLVPRVNRPRTEVYGSV